MQEPNDHELLAQFSQQNSEAAFAALVSRHVNLVYSVALRKTGQPHAAEEIAQAAFIILARKARNLPPRTILAGWLCETARLTAANYLRTEIRRQKREQEAHMQSLLNEPPPADDLWKQITPLLDDALAKLGGPERNAVVLRFFENKSLRDVGTALGVSEDAAKRRVHRALEKLRKIFLKRGVTLPALALGGMLAANSVQAAPVSLAAAISVTAVKGSAVTASSLTLVKGALKLMAWTKVKTAIVTSALVVLTAAIVTPSVVYHHHLSKPLSAPPNPAGLTSPAVNPKTADEAARAIFEAWGRNDWTTFARFWEPGNPPIDTLFNADLKRSLFGLKIVSLGTPSNSFGPNEWFVPYKIRFTNGQVKEFRLNVAQDTITSNWVFKGGF